MKRNMINTVDVPKVKVHSLFGYDGLPKRFIAQSQYGYLGLDSWGKLASAYISPTRQSAIARIKRLYPESILES